MRATSHHFLEKILNFRSTLCGYFAAIDIQFILIFFEGSIVGDCSFLGIVDLVADHHDHDLAQIEVFIYDVILLY